jgi:hypothetical protein
MIMTCLVILVLVVATSEDPPNPPKQSPKAEAKKKKGVSPKERDRLETLARELILKKPNSEAAQMAKAILEGKQLGAGVGWFSIPPGKKYDWDWLARTHQIPVDGSLVVSKLPKSSPLMRLDRDGSREITRADLDWSDTSPWVRQQQTSEMLFRKLDLDGSGKISENEWKSAFKKANQGLPLSQDSLREMFFSNRENRKQEQRSPPKAMLLKGLFSGEIGCTEEGPAVGESAPDFELATAQGESYRLSQYRGRQPVVIVFGSFT